MMHYDIKPVDTWIYYELCGQSLGSSLYELKGEGYKGEERIYRVRNIYYIFIIYYLSRYIIRNYIFQCKRI